MKVDPRHSTLLSAALLLRGDVTVSDAQRNLARLRPQLRLPHWNHDGVKVGLCGAAPVGQPHALLALTNSSCFAGVLAKLGGRFDRLYKRKAHLHHFTEYMDAGGIAEARECVQVVREAYAGLNNAPVPDEALALLDRLRTS